MEIALIAALGGNYVIGRQGRLPWHHPADLRFFERTTRGHPVIMGRVTYESLPRRPLPRRANLVLSRRAKLELGQGAVHCRSLEEALQWCRTRSLGRVFVAGGGQIYRQSLPLADVLFITWVPDLVSGDTFFPALDLEQWEIVDTRREGRLSFTTYRRLWADAPAQPPVHR